MSDARGPSPLTTLIVNMLKLPADKLEKLDAGKMATRWGVSRETVEHWVKVRRGMLRNM